MVMINVKYIGDLHCEVTHVPSGQMFMTDAPVDNNGKGEFISPTDLTAASIASCIATIMGIRAKAEGIALEGLEITAYKDMVSSPHRRIGTITLKIEFPREYDERSMTILKNVVKTCPVSRSLASEVEIKTEFLFYKK